MVGPENGNFSLLYIMEMSLCSRWVVLKSLKTPLRNTKMAPNGITLLMNGPKALNGPLCSGSWLRTQVQNYINEYEIEGADGSYLVFSTFFGQNFPDESGNLQDSS